MEKKKILLSEEKETLLVPLFSKAIESTKEHPIIVDKKAEGILEDIDYDFTELKIPKQTLLTLAMRAKKLDCYVNEYVKKHISPLVLHLGCGLDSRCLRTDSKNAQWYDIDFPDVIQLRSNFYHESENYHMIGSSILDPSWIDRIKQKGPACIIAEGLFMYLEENELKKLFNEMQKCFSPGEIYFDAYSTLTAKNVKNHPSVKKTGATIQWGIDDPREIENWNNTFRFIEEWFFTDSEDIPSLALRDRILFRVMGTFLAAKRAHRIIGYIL